ncbi:helix-turn-helix domain-containing protein [Arachidicoccus sp.]|uniref:helix-turn-helix domain-containing protein n=1 Tax=Arachidicoccus sp. TaxID=1872624 RepID=UPI003D1EC0A9
MLKEYRNNATLGHFIMHVRNGMFRGVGITDTSSKSINTFVFNKGAEQEVIIDEVKYTMPAQSVLPLMHNQHFVFEYPEALVAWQFNREFYCIVDHDAEVGCVGFLFYGIHNPMFIVLNKKELKELSDIERSFSDEINVEDSFQGEMLRSLLKRLIIKITRTAQKQVKSYDKFSNEKMDLIRNFSLFLEGNFRKEHAVKFYAAALNKSPKTLSNFFAMCHEPSPVKVIHNRIILEAKRYLHYTDKTSKEIAYELGFENPEHFSRFFKSNTGKNISAFRKEDNNTTNKVK